MYDLNVYYSVGPVMLRNLVPAMDMAEHNSKVQQYVQFDVLQDEDPNVNLAIFLGFCDTFKINGITDDIIHLWLFLFSLKSKAK
ncbi:Integrase-like protein [Gossypium australe]|uniref:Integrase-like protein n=1 Tax=Gossypium australe TaxID=47621 RepID=A0A5B6W0U3_9ROSI|nr:Integrase-like protein [Gossypium australe]